jgi:uncharacterized protein YyaL (SSP411 family)
VSEQGNFVDPHTGFRANILHVVDPAAEVPAGVERAKVKLLERRGLRVRPGLDDKILLAWNALMLDALARAAAALERDDWMEAARTNTRFLLGELRRDDGRFLRSWRAPYLAYAEDYAALLEALLTMAEVDDPGWLTEARAVADELLRLFHDPDGRGFFTTGHDAEALVVRPKDVFDDATPSANSLAANGLLRLAALTGDVRYESPAVDVAEMLARPMTSQPTAFAHMLEACERVLTAPLEVAIVGPADDPRTRSLRREVHHRLLPATVTLTGPPSDASPLLEGREARDLVPTAYVCAHYTCRQPVTSPEELRAQLDAVLAGRRGS